MIYQLKVKFLEYISRINRFHWNHYYKCKLYIRIVYAFSFYRRILDVTSTCTSSWIINNDQYICIFWIFKTNITLVVGIVLPFSLTKLHMYKFLFGIVVAAVVVDDHCVSHLTIHTTAYLKNKMRPHMS